MVKRRRERDRPKAANEAAYHPNKRVLLSYASDEESAVAAAGGHPAGTGFPQAVNTVTADYEIPVYPEEDEAEAEDTPQQKAELGAVDVVEEVEDELKEQRHGGNSLWSRTVSRNPSTGQWPALGSLSYQQDAEDEEGAVDDDEDSEEYDNDEDEAMAYLRSVRTERQSMPTFFGAGYENVDEELCESGVGDARGYVSDGAYVGRPDEDSSAQLAADSAETGTRKMYMKAMKERFLAARRQMHTPPGPGARTSLDNQHPTTFRPGSNKDYAEWVCLLRTTAPLPAQIRLMSQEIVYQLLEVIQRHRMVREREITKATSAWIWSLLARLDDVSTLDNGQVYNIRELGKRAVLVQLSFHDRSAAAHLESVSGDPTASSTVDEEVQQMLEEDDPAIKHNGDSVKTNDEHKSTANGEEPNPADSPERQNTLATLDVIICLVGDVFGQRDLLEFRRPWTATNQAGETA